MMNDSEEDILYEECPDCHGQAEFCLTCFDQGIVIHDCSTMEEQ